MWIFQQQTNETDRLVILYETVVMIKERYFFFRRNAISGAPTLKVLAPNNYLIPATRRLCACLASAGMTNIVGAFTGCFPTFGSMARSKIQDSAGCKTQATGNDRYQPRLIVTVLLDCFCSKDA
jgi:hypothetical protein